MINYKIRKLEWDSKFWGINIYNAESNEETIKMNMNLRNELDSNPYIIQALSLDSDIKHINTLENDGFRFVESKVKLVKRKQNLSSGNELNFEELKLVIEEDLIKRKDIFYELYGKKSRYSLLNDKKVNEFYYTWASKSIRGKFDDKCIGYYKEGVLQGFITFKKVENKIVIGLVGVFPEYQGKGISQQLLNYVNYQAVLDNCKEISISTQGKNTKAINAYIKNGFIIEDIKHWYYLIGGIK